MHVVEFPINAAWIETPRSYFVPAGVESASRQPPGPGAQSPIVDEVGLSFLAAWKRGLTPATSYIRSSLDNKEGVLVP
jgi:hypothetical protein